MRFLSKNANGDNLLLNAISTFTGSPNQIVETDGTGLINSSLLPGNNGASGIAATCTTTDTGVALESLNLTVSSPSTGVYDYIFASPLPNNTYAVSVTPTNETTFTDRNAQVINKTVNGFTVELRTGDNGGTVDVLTNVAHDVIVVSASFATTPQSLVTSVNGQAGAVNLTTTDIPEGTNLYYTETRVSNNADVAANTVSRHNPVTLGTANGLSLLTQQLSLALATVSTNGAMSASDKLKLNNLGSYILRVSNGGSDNTINYNTGAIVPLQLNGLTTISNGDFTLLNNVQFQCNFSGLMLMGYNVSIQGSQNAVGMESWITRLRSGIFTVEYGRCYSTIDGSQGANRETLQGIHLFEVNANDVYYVDILRAGNRTSAVTTLNISNQWAVRIL